MNPKRMGKKILIPKKMMPMMMMIPKKMMPMVHPKKLKPNQKLIINVLPLLLLLPN